jgi:hypothetical protein
MENKHRTIAITVSVLMTLAGLVLFIDRGGVLSLVGLIAGSTLLIKTFFRSSKLDIWLCVGVAVIWGLVWLGTFYYVISTWESGEVVELAVDAPDGTHTARVWVLDTDKALVLYYDAEPNIAEAMLSGRPIKVTREGQVVNFTHINVRSTEDISQEELDSIFQMWADKYGARNEATDVFYQMLGRSRDRIAVVIKIDKE